MKLKKIKNKFNQWGGRFIYPPHPILAHIESDLLNQFDESYIIEPKFNDSRLLLIKQNNEWLFFNRHGSKLTYTPTKDLLEQLNKLNIPNNSVFDGGLLHFKNKHIKNTIIIWDILVLENIIQSKYSYSERRITVENLFKQKTFKADYKWVFNFLIKNLNKQKIFLIPQIPTKNIKETFQYFVQNDPFENLFEGIVIKDTKAKLTYSFSSRPDCYDMIKLRKKTKNYNF